MFAEIQKLESAARIAMGHFEEPAARASADSAAARSQRALLSYSVLVIGFAGILAVALL